MAHIAAVKQHMLKLWYKISVSVGKAKLQYPVSTSKIYVHFKAIIHIMFSHN